MKFQRPIMSIDKGVWNETKCIVFLYSAGEFSIPKNFNFTVTITISEKDLHGTTSGPIAPTNITNATTPSIPPAILWQDGSLRRCCLSLEQSSANASRKPLHFRIVTKSGWQMEETFGVDLRGKLFLIFTITSTRQALPRSPHEERGTSIKPSVIDSPMTVICI